jgi:predicted peptidase
VDRFAYGVSADGIKYRLFTPSPIKKNDERPLIIWLHGAGEGGIPGYYANETRLLANRGALGPATPEAQAIFKGAYVVAPQVPDSWYNLDQAGYAEKIKALIDQLTDALPIDSDRVYVMGASAGGFMAVQMASRYPTFFAAAVPTCPALYLSRTGQYTVTAEQVLQLNSTPTWFIHAKNDPVVPYQETSLWAYNLLDEALLTAYDNVVWNGYEFNGHWSWIYTARNDPTTDKGRTLWEWMARQTVRHPGVKT